MICDLCPNVYIDTSSTNSWVRYLLPEVTLADAFRAALDVAGASRLLFGSDYLRPGQQIPQFEILAAMNLPDEVQYKIHRGNALRLLKLPGE